MRKKNPKDGTKVPFANGKKSIYQLSSVSLLSVSLQETRFYGLSARKYEMLEEDSIPVYTVTLKTETLGLFPLAMFSKFIHIYFQSSKGLKRFDNFLEHPRKVPDSPFVVKKPQSRFDTKSL